MSFRSNASFVITALLVSAPRVAQAGGLEMPDLGTEALGRGGAFTAKADDPTAIHHNVAGLAQQRGTRLLLNANASKSSLRFQREGTYADAPSAATPWGGQRYPEVDNQGKPVVLPFMAATTDFGTDFLTVALAVYAPPLAAYAGRTYPLSVNGAPSPVRYDTVGGTSSLVLFYTGAAGLRLGEAVDVGVAVHAVQASIETRSVSYIDMAQCKNAEYQPCDGRSDGAMTGWTATASAGVLARLGAGVTSGLHVRGPVMMQTVGEAQTTTPRALGGTTMPPSRMALRNALPLVARAGVRKAFPAAGGKTEAGDVELDVTYERWSDAQSPGPRALLEKLGTFDNVALTVKHVYQDTFSVRLGGAYNFAAGSVPLTLRAGAFYDGAATETANTRVDADTLAKLAGTVGASARFGSFAFNVAYAGVFDVPRSVTDGDVRPINAARGGASEDSKGNPLAAVNNGTYTGFTHVLSLGLTVELDTLLGFGRGASPPPSTQGRSAVGARL